MNVLLVRLIVLRCDATILNRLLSQYLYLYRTPQPTNPDITVIYADIDRRGAHALFSYSGRAIRLFILFKGGSTKVRR
jgi:hypothetical protein